MTSTDHASLPAVCAVDLGTSGVRAAVIDLRGRILSNARVERAKTGMVSGTFDVEGLWTDVLFVMQKALAGATRPVEAIGVAGFVGTILLDREGAPLNDGSDWSDSRGVALMADRLSNVASLLEQIGRPTLSAGTLSVLLRLLADNPDALTELGSVLSPKDFIVARLSGEISTDNTSAAYTQLLDVRRLQWATQTIGELGLDPDAFPRLRYGIDVVGAVTAGVSIESGLPAGIPVIAGGPDGTIGAALAIGNHPDVIVDVAGTTDVITTLLDSSESRVPPSTVLNPYVVPGRWSCGGPTGMTGGALSWMSTLLGLGPIAEATKRLGANLDALPPGADGVTVIPALSGSRFPFWTLQERASVIGLQERHSPTHVLRATQEAVAFTVRAGVDLLDPGRTWPIVLAGGAARSPALAQLRADVLGRTILACVEPDTSLIGAAALAAAGTGLHPDLETASEAMRSPYRPYEPSWQRSEAYAELAANWDEERQYQARSDRGRTENAAKIGG